jgi:hypothetical protein
MKMMNFRPYKCLKKDKTDEKEAKEEKEKN